MYFLINILGIFIVMSVIYFCSPRKKKCEMEADSLPFHR